MPVVYFWFSAFWFSFPQYIECPEKKSYHKMKDQKYIRFFCIPKIWQILKHFTRSFHQAKTSYFRRVDIYYHSIPLLCKITSLKYRKTTNVMSNACNITCFSGRMIFIGWFLLISVFLRKSWGAKNYS